MTHNKNRTRAQLPLHKKRSFPLRISTVNMSHLQYIDGLVTFTEEILHGKLHFLCSVLQTCT